MLSPESFLNAFLNLFIPPWMRKSFKFIVLRLLTNTFVSQKIESVHFYSCPQGKISPRILSLSSRQKNITHSSRTAFSKDIFFSAERGEGGGGRGWWSWKNTKIKPTRVLSQVLINSTIFVTFTFLIYVLLCHNLLNEIIISNMLKCEGSLT